MHDADAAPIAKGRLGKQVEFGFKAQVCDNIDSIVLDHGVETGNPPNGPRLELAITRISERSGAALHLTAYRGDGEAAIEDALQNLAVQHVVFPRKGKPGRACQACE